MVDGDNGEWFWSIKADGTINTDEDKVKLRGDLDRSPLLFIPYPFFPILR